MSRDYQAAYRRQQKVLRRPGRDDVARVVLHWVITESLRNGRHRDLDRLSRVVVRRLAAQGFAEDEAEKRFDDLIERYEEGWAFRRKRHLEHDGGGE